jgi:hypothetical protein
LFLEGLEKCRAKSGRALRHAGQTLDVFNRFMDCSICDLTWMLCWVLVEISPTKKQKVEKKLPTAIVLDIEGTVAPISFVKDVLFNYARAHLRSHLEATFDTEETQADIQLLREQVCLFRCVH